MKFLQGKEYREHLKKRVKRRNQSFPNKLKSWFLHHEQIFFSSGNICCYSFHNHFLEEGDDKEITSRAFHLQQAFGLWTAILCAELHHFSSFFWRGLSRPPGMSLPHLGGQFEDNGGIWISAIIQAIKKAIWRKKSFTLYGLKTTIMINHTNEWVR